MTEAMLLNVGFQGNSTPKWELLLRRISFSFLSYVDLGAGRVAMTITVILVLQNTKPNLAKL